jgi:long-chain acyl-CoA synthetase
MINRAGYKVYSVEVENVLTHHVAIIEAAVVGRPDPVLGERVHAFIVPKSQVASAEEIRAFCAERLSDYKVPDRITFLNQPLPRNAAGKVLKGELRKMIEAEATA